MKSHPLHCWDCGIQIIVQDGRTFRALANMREVRFGLTGNAVMQSPFCVECALKPWTPERMAEYKAAVDAVNPSARCYRILQHEATLPAPDVIEAVFS